MIATTNYTIDVRHGEGSRVMNLILSHLKADPALKVTSVKTPLHLRTEEDHIYEHFVRFRDPQTPNKLWHVLNEITAAIPQLFEKNYFFKITSGGLDTFGYRHEGSFGVSGSKFFNVYVKIAEVKKTSKPIESYKIEVD